MKRLSSEAECDAAKAMSDGAQTEWDAAKGKPKVPKRFSKMWYTKNDAVGVRHKCGAHRQIFHIRCSELSIDSLCDLDDVVLEGLNSGCMTESEAKLSASSDPRKLIYFAGARRNGTQQSNTFAHSGSDIAPARLRCCSFHRTSQALSAQVFAIEVLPSVCKLACRGTEDGGPHKRPSMRERTLLRSRR